MQRWEPDGEVDPTFHPLIVKGEDAGSVHVLACEPDGKILLGGSFRMIDGQRRHGLARLTTEGRLDPTFDPGTGTEVIPFDEADETPEATAEGGLFIAGRFDLYDGSVSHNVAQLWDLPPSIPPTPALGSGEPIH